MIARGSLGNPWIFAELTGGATSGADRGEIEAELRWVLDRAEEHWGPERAARNLRKLYPWYVQRLGFEGPDADRFQRTETLDEVRELLLAGPRAANPGAASPQRYNRPPARPRAPQSLAFRAFLCREDRVHRGREKDRGRGLESGS